jgi:hypothetical protein
MPTARLSVVGHHCSRLPALAPPGSPLVAHLLRRRAPPSSISSSCATCRVPHCIVQLLATGHDPPHPHARATRLWSGLPGVHNVHTPSSAIPSFWSALRHWLRAMILLILTLVRHACGAAFPESTTFTPPPQPYLVFGLRSATAHGLCTTGSTSTRCRVSHQALGGGAGPMLGPPWLQLAPRLHTWPLLLCIWETSNSPCVL